MRLIPLQNAEHVGYWSARYIVDRINNFAPTPKRPFVLGLTTGGPPPHNLPPPYRVTQTGRD